MSPLYGVGYEPIGDLADFIDPFGIRKIPGAVAGSVALVGVLAGGFFLYRRAQKQSGEGTR